MYQLRNSLLVLSFILVFSSSLFVNASPVGSIPGAFSIGTDGAANYRIPLELPPGINGLTPDLALEYDSQKGNGLLGIGWRLTGFPSITRCPTTLEQDGFIDGVDFDNNDKYCLNGQRLVAVNGTYGASGTEYRTEQDSFKKIISYGTAGHGPAYFQVWYKDGNFIELGSTEDAQVEAQSKPNEVFRWDISKIQDRFGNTVTFHYSEQTDSGEHYPVAIRYANTAINFTLEERPDPILTYISGVKHLIKQRIKTITIAQDNNQRRYVLNYGTAGRPLKSLLASIQYCTDQCFPATHFSWQRNENTASSFNSASLLRPSGKPYEKDNAKKTGDFNGDGLIDLAWAYSGPQGLDISIALAKGDGTFLSGQLQRVSGTPYEKDNTAQTGDFNGDGLTDLAWMYSSQHGLDVSVALSNGDGSFQQAHLRKLTSAPYEKENTKLTGDFNGDGRTDFAWMYSGPQGLDVTVALSNGDGTFGAPRLKRVSAQGYEKDNTALAGDFNGDGITDIAWMYSSAHGLDITTATALGDGDFAPAIFKRVSTVGYEKDSTKLTGDFNGDGLTDLAWAYAGPLGLDVSVALAKGDGSFTQAVVKRLNSSPYEHDNTALTGDFNGDRMTDLAWVYSSQAGLDVTVALGVGDGTFLPATLKRLSGLAYEKDNAKLTGDFNGDGLIDLAWLYSGPSGLDETVALSLEKKSLVSQITNGLGHTTKLTYKPLTDKTTFTKSTISQYPVKDVQPAVHVVSEVKKVNGIGGELTTQYHYKGLKRHQRGLGALGFAKITSTQLETGIKTTDHYLQDVANRKIGLLSRSQTWSATGVLLKDTQQTWQVNTLDDGDIKRFQTHLVSRKTQQKSLQDEWLSTLTETFSYDDWGNTTEAKQIIKDALGQQTSTTASTYQNDESNWLIGLATQTQATNVGVSGDSQTRTTQFNYDSMTGALTQRIQAPGQGDYVLTTDFKYDRVGNLIEEQTQGANVAARKQTYTYDAQGLLLISTTNALGHTTQQTSDAFWGVPFTTTDSNGLMTSYGYDAFGRLTTQKAPDNSQTFVTRGWCHASTACPAGAVYWVTTKTEGSAPSTVYMDQLERTIRTETLALTGETQYQDTVYNTLGQMEKTSLPYFKGHEVYWIQYEYDPLQRVIKTTQPNGSTTEVAYQGLNKVLTNAKGQTKTEHYNGAGQLVKVIDAQDSTLSYTYDSFGNLTQTTDPDNNTVDLTYDVLGRKIAMNDPDKGAWTYEYDALGRLIRQQDAKGQVTKLSYDQLDRLVKQTENAQASSKLLWRVSEWQYDQQRKGQLDHVTVDGITQQYQYDNLGRVTSETQTLFGESFTLSYSYDQYSRPLQTTFPTGLTAKQVYNERGYLTAILDGNANTYWQAQAVDALGNITQQQYGNGATTLRVFDKQTGRLQDSGTYMGSTRQIEDLHFAYDELGNLTQREDKRQKIQETFAYDQLNRLTEVTALLSGNTQTTTVQYDRLGNIIHKLDVGNYSYAGKCGNQQAGPHALTQTTGSQNATYCYDANGNMTSGNGRTVRYTAFDKPDQIIRGDYQIDLVYGPDQKRVRRIDHGPTGTSTTYYQSGIYEKVVSDTGKIQHKHYIADVAIITKTENAGTDNGLNVNYFHRDHLNSLTAITDQNGQVVERFSYDPWGKRRQTDWQAAIDFTKITSTITKRGFTNHEHLDGVGLVHMNGRVYDPNMGRFLSADPFIPYPNYMQSYNRYTYASNNPLAFVDSNGYWETRGAVNTGTENAGRNHRDSRESVERAAEREREIERARREGRNVYFEPTVYEQEVDSSTGIVDNRLVGGGGVVIEGASHNIEPNLERLVREALENRGLGDFEVSLPYVVTTIPGDGIAAPVYTHPETLVVVNSDWEGLGLIENSLWGAFKGLFVTRIGQFMKISHILSGGLGTAFSSATTENLFVQARTIRYEAQVSDWNGKLYHGINGALKAIDFQGLTNTRTGVLETAKQYRVIAGSKVIYTSKPERTSIGSVSDHIPNKNGYPIHDYP